MVMVIMLHLPDDDDLHPDPSTILPLQEVSTAFEQALPPTPLNIPYPTTAPHIPTSVLNPSPETSYSSTS